MRISVRSGSGEGPLALRFGAGVSVRTAAPTALARHPASEV